MLLLNSYENKRSSRINWPEIRFLDTKRFIQCNQIPQSFPTPCQCLAAILVK